MEKLHAADITYHWGFPGCLVAIKNSHSVTLKFKEDLQGFCLDLNIDPPELPNWHEATTIGMGYSNSDVL